MGEFSFCQSLSYHSNNAWMSELGLTKNEDVLSDLKKHSITKLQDNLKKVMMMMIKDTLNRYNSDINPNFLYHIGTGNASQESTATFFLKRTTKLYSIHYSSVLIILFSKDL